MATQSAPAEVSYNSITRSLANRPNKKAVEQHAVHCDPFLPQNKAKSLVQRDRVESTLKKWFGKETSTKELMDYIMGGAEKVFLTLAYIEAGQHYMRSLHQANFTDTHFPICTVLREEQNEDDIDEYDTHGVDVDGTPKYPQEKALACFSGWSPKHLDDFVDKQWVFLAPKFRQDKFSYEFHEHCRLPFVPTPDIETSRGYFGTIRKLGLHIEHQDFSSSHKKSRTNGDYVQVAVKLLTLQGPSSATDVDKFYAKEMQTLAKMRNLQHPHLIRAIAAYKKGSDRCFVFPWAQGGNLQRFWETDRSVLDEGLVSWAIDQMTGISEGVMKLHQEKTRHGDIKPDNILHFGNLDDSDIRGTLVVADVGLAKVHTEYTRYRVAATTTRYGSQMYEPPEMPSYLRGNPVPRAYDIWGLGCVFLEFTVWLLHGRKGLDKFHKELKDTDPARFWKQDRGGPQRHPAVYQWINDEIRNRLKKDSALWDLVDLISTRLLVPTSNKDHADANTLFERLKDIRTKCSESSSYKFSPELAVLAKHRPGPDDLAGETPTPLSNQYNPRTSKLDNQWRNVADNSWARALMSRLDWPSLRPSTDMTRICHSCNTIDFLSTDLDLRRSLGDLERGSDECCICHFLCRCLSKAQTKSNGTVKLFIDNTSHTFRASSDGLPILSTYFDPDSSGHSPSHAQLGLPLLPKFGSSQQFRLLNEWIHLCNTTHDCLSDPANAEATGNMPTRLVYVGKRGSPCLRLVETRENIKGEYIALSHCWGILKKEERFCTYTDNIESLKQEIPYEALPKTFQDAVTVTRALGVLYLWIDSLCIIQENKEDWEAEAAAMEDVFSSAYCTIAASCATSSLDGFLGDRIPRAAIAIQTSQGPLYLAEAIDDFKEHVERSVLNTRGWVFQERALSRRTIHFTSTQVYWECGKGIHCETLAELRNSQTEFLGDSKFPSYGLSYYKDERIRLVQHLHQVYSGLHLTKASDRPKAILGLQERLARTFGSRAKHGVLLAYFERTLLWEAEVPGGLSRITYGLGQLGPSWSWMAYTGGIRYMDIPFNQVNWTGNFRDPLGPESDDAGWDGRLLAEASHLLIDEMELSRRSKIDRSDCKFEPLSWRCVVVGKSKTLNEGGDASQYVLLIRRRSSSEIPHTYERVGVGMLRGTQVVPGTTKVWLV